jgi:hypothetical protein
MGVPLVNARPLAWGARVSGMFRDRVREIAQELGMPDEGADWLMACMAWESGETFSAHQRNLAGSGAVGLIQFMPIAAVELGTDCTSLACLSPLAQLEYVKRYFQRYAKRLRTLADVYMAILWPAAIGKPDDYVLWTRSTKPVTYRQNIGLDINRNFDITKAEATFKVAEMLRKGLSPGYAAA